LQSVAFSP